MTKKHQLAAFVSLFLLCSIQCNAQKINVLFLGNSYTQVNNLPSTLVNLTQDATHSMMVESNTPGGYTFDQHSQNAISLEKIRKGIWDYVVLQEQSQMPSIDYYRYSNMYPAAERLRDSIIKYNPCAEIILYMTWGRRDGGQQCENYGDGLYCSADFRDFDHMQDTMTSSYYELTQRLKCNCAPAGEAWRTAIHQTDFNLFSADGSHPSTYGTYLTACVFYASIWNESAIGLNTAFEISEEDAQTLQEIADETVFNSGTEWNLVPKVTADFDVYFVDEQTIKLRNNSLSDYPETSYLWDFGDGTTSEEAETLHEYAEPGTYLISLTVTGCHQTDTKTEEIVIEDTSTIDESNYNTAIYPNPTHNEIHFVTPTFGDLIIRNTIGQTVLQKQMYGETYLDLSDLENGIYFISIKANKTQNIKLIKH